MRLESRSVFGWGASKAGYANPKNGLVVHFDGSKQGLAKKSHSSCRTYWKNTRSFHMGSARGWADIGYSFACCPHGVVMEGRGLNKVQAAQPGGNSTWYSVTFMSGPGEKPTPAQVKAFQELRSWLRGKGVSSAVSYHGRFIATDCPGGVLRTMVQDGSLTKPQVVEEEEETLKRVCVLGMSDEVEVGAGERKSIPYAVEYVDKDKMHTDADKEAPQGYPSFFPKKKADYLIQGRVAVDGLQKGDRVALIVAEYERKTNTLTGSVYEKTVIGDGWDGVWDDVFCIDQLDTDHKYRIDLLNPQQYPVTLKYARLTVAM